MLRWASGPMIISFHSMEKASINGSLSPGGSRTIFGILRHFLDAITSPEPTGPRRWKSVQEKLLSASISMPTLPYWTVRRILVLLFASVCSPLNSSPSWAAELVVLVRDAQDQALLPGATLAVLGTEFGGHSDGEGRCRIEGLPPGQYDLLCSFVGYRPQTLRDLATGDREYVVALEPSTLALPGVVVSAVGRSQTAAEAPISIAVADAAQIADYNTVSLVAPLRYISGISQVGDQVNIRGSSGYSRGTGSRILMLVDGFSLLSADVGDIKWDAVPLHQVERVEVVKGAGSALYGTGALGGVINVLTRDPGKRPSTRFRLLSGLYSQPAYRQWRWTEDPMYLAGFDLSHDRTIGRTGLALSGGHNRSTGYHQNGDGRRYHLYAKTVHRFSPMRYWRTMGNWARDDHGVFVQWRNRTQPLSVSEDDAQASTLSTKLHLNSEYYHLLRRDLGYRLKLGYYRTAFSGNAAAGGLSSSAHKLSGEAQFDFEGWRGWDWTLGLATTGDLVRSPADFLGERTLITAASYAHGVYALGSQADLAAGLRYDLNRRGVSGASGGGVCASNGAMAGKAVGAWSPQIGFSFRPRESSAIRFSVGRGFRAPAASEIFAQVQVSGLRVCPNPRLDPERAWSYEVGYKEQFAGLLALDLALFWNEYRGLIEGRPDIESTGSVPVARFQNLSRARVRGFEGEALIGLPLGLGARAAYTLVAGTEFFASDEVFPPYCHGDYRRGGQGPLPYRPRHLLNFGLQGGRGPLEGKVGFQYLSKFDRVSGLFPECGRDQVPIYLVDAQLSRRLGDLQINLRVDNIFQYHYTTSERKIRPLRRFSLSVDGEL